MDRRQLKTRKAIFRAFRTLLEKKRYDHITVQEIIDEADVGRSTFYAHFETKDLLLDALCQDLLYHIFQHDPCPWSGKDNDLSGKLSHALWHMQQERDGLRGILLGDSSSLFMEYFKEQLYKMFEADITQFPTDIPRDFLLNHLAGSFAEAVRWWMRQGMKTSPEELVRYFMKMTR